MLSFMHSVVLILACMFFQRACVRALIHYRMLILLSSVT